MIGKEVHAVFRAGKIFHNEHFRHGLPLGERADQLVVANEHGIRLLLKEQVKARDARIEHADAAAAVSDRRLDAQCLFRVAHFFDSGFQFLHGMYAPVFRRPQAVRAHRVEQMCLVVDDLQLIRLHHRDLRADRLKLRPRAGKLHKLTRHDGDDDLHAFPAADIQYGGNKILLLRRGDGIKRIDQIARTSLFIAVYGNDTDVPFAVFAQTADDSRCPRRAAAGHENRTFVHISFLLLKNILRENLFRRLRPLDKAQ